MMETSELNSILYGNIVQQVVILLEHSLHVNFRSQGDKNIASLQIQIDMMELESIGIPGSYVETNFTYLTALADNRKIKISQTNIMTLLKNLI